MTIDQNTLLFFDASCLIAAAGSSMGGSGFLLSLCARNFLRGIVSQVVLLEAEYNIQAKLGEKALAQYHNILQVIPLSVAPVPSLSRTESWSYLINPKDHHVMATVMATGAPHLLTLDQKLITEVNQAELSVQALTPGHFIRAILPTHKDYPRIR